MRTGLPSGSIRVIDAGTGAPRVRGVHDLDPGIDQTVPEVSNVGEVSELLGVLTHSGTEGEDVLPEQLLEVSQHGQAVHHDEVVLTITSGLVEPDGVDAPSGRHRDVPRWC